MIHFSLTGAEPGPKNDIFIDTADSTAINIILVRRIFLELKNIGSQTLITILLFIIVLYRETEILSIELERKGFFKDTNVLLVNKGSE